MTELAVCLSVEQAYFLGQNVATHQIKNRLSYQKKINPVFLSILFPWPYNLYTKYNPWRLNNSYTQFCRHWWWFNNCFPQIKLLFNSNPVFAKLHKTITPSHPRSKVQNASFHCSSIWNKPISNSYLINHSLFCLQNNYPQSFNKFKISMGRGGNPLENEYVLFSKFQMWNIRAG